MPRKPPKQISAFECALLTTKDQPQVVLACLYMRFVVGNPSLPHPAPPAPPAPQLFKAPSSRRKLRSTRSSREITTREGLDPLGLRSSRFLMRAFVVCLRHIWTSVYLQSEKKREFKHHQINIAGNDNAYKRLKTFLTKLRSLYNENHAEPHFLERKVCLHELMYFLPLSAKNVNYRYSLKPPYCGRF